MAQYLIVAEDDDNAVVKEVEAKHIKEAVEPLSLRDGESVTIYRLAGPGRTVTARVEQKRSIEIT